MTDITSDTENPEEPTTDIPANPTADELNPLFATPVKSDRYRKGIPPVFAESQEKYYQDELTKIERVLDLGYQDTTRISKDGAKLRASFKDEVTIRVTENEAMARRVETLSATVDSDRSNTAALIQIEQTARATKDDALAQQVTTLSASVKTTTDSLDAKIVAEQTARATQDSALAQSITTLTATVNTNTASISSESTARINADGALSSRIDTLNTAVGTNSAAITNEATARANADGANATAISNLTTTVNGNTASISQTSSVVDGLKAKWGVKINNNGRVAGVSLNSDNTGYSNFDVEANAFTIYSPGTTNKMIYWDGSTLVVKGDITANKITAQAVNALPDNTIDRPVLAKPNILGSGTYYPQSNEFPSAGYNGTLNPENSQPIDSWYSCTLFIPTGLYVDSSWTGAPSNIYMATAAIVSSSISNGGTTGYSMAQVLIGDGTGSDGVTVKNQIYIRYTFDPSHSGYGKITINAIGWKIVQI